MSGPARAIQELLRHRRLRRRDRDRRPRLSPLRCRRTPTSACAPRSSHGRWLEKNPNILFRNPKEVSTGAYGDGNCGDEQLWAAAELWRTTGEEAYGVTSWDHYGRFLGSLAAQGPQSWANLAPLALWTYVLGNGKERGGRFGDQDGVPSPPPTRSSSARRSNGYRVSLTSKDYIWGSNAVAANYAMQLLVANAIKPDPRIRERGLDNLHYLLGRNTFSLSFVTQVGANPFRHPHHRPSGADKNAEPWPGLLAGRS